MYFLKGGEGFIGVWMSGLPGSELKAYRVSSGYSYIKSMVGIRGPQKRHPLLFVVLSRLLPGHQLSIGREKASLVIPASLREVSKIP